MKLVCKMILEGTRSPEKHENLLRKMYQVVFFHENLKDLTIYTALCFPSVTMGTDEKIEAL